MHRLSILAVTTVSLLTLGAALPAIAQHNGCGELGWRQKGLGDALQPI